MSFLLPEDKVWSVANWVSRGFFADAQLFLEEAPALADDIKFCIEAETDTVDLRAADQAILKAVACSCSSCDFSHAQGRAEWLSQRRGIPRVPQTYRAPSRHREWTGRRVRVNAMPSLLHRRWQLRAELRGGEKVIIDTEGLSPGDLALLKAAVKHGSLEAQVIFHE